MNTYAKYCPNVFVAKCEQKYNKGEAVQITTKYGKENECIIFNLLFEKEGFFYYSIVRADGFNVQEHAKKRAEKLQGYAQTAEAKSEHYYNKSNEHRDFLSLCEPIKVGHHSEKRHRKIIDQAWNNMGKSVEFSDKAKEYESRVKYWEERASKINLSMPESLEFYEFELEKAKKHHADIKENPEKRTHSMSLQYANKAIKDLEDKVNTAIKLWGSEEEIRLMQEEKREQAEAKKSKSNKFEEAKNKYFAFFAFNNEQFKEGYSKAKNGLLLEEGEKIVGLGAGLYVAKKYVEEFKQAIK